MGKPQRLKTASIGAVLAQHVGLEMFETLAPGERRQVSEEAGRDSASVIVLLDDKRHFRRAFGVRRFARDVASHSNDRLAPRRFGRHDQRHFAHEVDVDRAIELGVGEIVSGAEEPRVDRILFQQPERLQKGGPVVGPDRADRHASAVLEDVADREFARMVHDWSIQHLQGRATGHAMMFTPPST